MLLADQQLFYTKIVLHGGEGVMNDKMMFLLGLASMKKMTPLIVINLSVSNTIVWC
ncbi:hypothetical protein [Globicatella sanguinis]